jgi:hypothetical protein
MTPDNTRYFPRRTIPLSNNSIQTIPRGDLPPGNSLGVMHITTPSSIFSAYAADVLPEQKLLLT